MKGKIYEFEDYLLDVSEQRLQKNGDDISLAPKVFEVLCVLVRNSGVLVSYQELMEEVWSDTFVEDTNLRYCIHSLRKNFDEDFIETVPKFGYRFNSKVTEFTKEEFIKKHLKQPETPDFYKPEETQVNFPDGSAGTKFSNDSKPGRPYTRLGFTIAMVGFLTFFTGILSYFWIYPNYLSANPKNKPQLTNVNLSYDRVTDSGRAFFPGLSNDDQKVAYVLHSTDNRYSIILQHLATKSETEILAPQPYAPVSLQFSPDGNFIFFSMMKKDSAFSIYRIPIFGGEIQTIYKGIYNHFSISPDGKSLAFYSPDPEKTQSHLMICNSSDGSGQRIVSTRKAPKTYWVWGSAPNWSPDGRKLVASVFTPFESEKTSETGGNSSTSKNHLIEIDALTGKETIIKSPEWHMTPQAYWVENGNALLVSVKEKRGEPVQIWYLKYPSGDASNLTRDSNDYRHFRPASDMSFILAETWIKSDNLYLFPSHDPSKIRQLTFETSIENGVYGLRWTTDGKHLLYVRTNGFGSGNLFIFELETRKSRQLTFDKESFPNYVDVTPDGNSAVFASNRTGEWHVWQIDLNGDNLRQLTDSCGEVAPDISPDGKWLYYTVTDGSPFWLWKQPLSGGEPIKVLPGVGGVTQVSPKDPDKIISFYFDGEEKSKSPYKIMLFSETNPDKLMDLEINPVHRFEWKPDGTGIYFTDGGESFNNIWFVSVKDKTTSQFTHFTDQKIADIDISPDGETFAVSRGSFSGKIFKISGYDKNWIRSGD